MASSATDVFVSYKAEDRARLKPLVQALEAEGFRVWWDAHIGTGADWREEIQQHLDAARCVIVAWSQHSVGPEGQFVCDEASRAKKAGTYVPIKIDEVDPPLGFGGFQALSFVGWKGRRRDPRFVALVAAVRAHLGGKSPVVRRGVIESKVSRRTAMTGGVGALAVVGAGGWALLKPGAAVASNRIAVMSFSNMSGDPAQAYFSDGIAEELRGALTRIGMQVIGKASCDAVKDLEIPAAAAKLGVANILTGSVRRSPDTIRVGAQLVNGKDGVERWTENYDRAPGDTIKIQIDIAIQVASALRLTLGAVKRAALTLGGTSDSAALDLYLQATVLDGNADSAAAVLKVIALTDAAIARDPKYGNAYLTRAGAEANFGARYATSTERRDALLESAKQSALRAASLMPGSGLPAAMLSGISSIRLDFASALRGLEQAVASNPNDGPMLESVIYQLAALTGGPRPLQLADRVITLNPLSPDAYFLRGFCLYSLRRFKDAIQAFGKGLALAPQRTRPRYWIAFCHTLLNRFVEAQAALTGVPADDLFRQTAEALIAARSGDRAGAYAQIAKIRSTGSDQLAFQYAQIYAQIGDLDYAIASLDKAIEVGDPGLQLLKHDPFLDPIRRDPRYASLLQRLKFPT